MEAVWLDGSRCRLNCWSSTKCIKLTVEGRYLRIKNNNQPILEGRDREDVGEEVQPGWIAGGRGVVPSFGATKWNNEKMRDGQGLGLRQPCLIKRHNNQPTVSICCS